MKRSVQSTLKNWFKKPCTEDIAETQSTRVHSPQPAALSDCDDCDDPVPSTSNDIHTNILSNHWDIGHAVSRLKTGEHITNEEKLHFITDPYLPPENFEWPKFVRNRNGTEKTYIVGRKHFVNENGNTMSYSPSLKGIFCRACVFFAPSGVGNNKNNKALQFVTQPFTNYRHYTGDKAKGKPEHESRSYHQDAVKNMIMFIENMKNPQHSVIAKVDAAEAERIKQNRKMVRPMVQNTLLLARCGLPFRGSDSSGFRIPKNDGDIDASRGNFQCLLEARCSWGDEELKAHLESRQYMSYKSQKVQNQFLLSAGNVIRAKIASEIHDAHFIAVLADETMDSRHIEQLCVAVRYIKENDIVERFLTFIPLESQSAESIKEAIIKSLQEFPIDLTETKIIGQSYDGASVMKGLKGGVQKLIRDTFPVAFYVHCSAHAFNLGISRATNVSEIDICLSTINSLATFFNESSKRTGVLTRAINACVPESKRSGLHALCETRWAARVTSIKSFIELLAAVYFALCTLVDSRDSIDAETRCRANGFAKTMSDESFLFSLALLEETFALISPISDKLQRISVELPEAIDYIKVCIRSVQSWLRGVGCGSFKRIVQRSEELQSMIDEQDKSLQKYERLRHKIKPSSFQEKIYKPFLQDFINLVKGYFDDHFKLVAKFAKLLPASLGTFEDVKDLFLVYMENNIINCTEIELEREFEMFKNVCKEKKEMKNYSITELSKSCKTYMPNLSDIFKILATIPCSTATAERSFSSMGFINSILRCSMTQDRLNDLCTVYVHRDIPLSSDEVITEFSKLNHRIQFS